MVNRSRSNLEEDAHDQTIADAVARARAIPFVISRTYRRSPDVSKYTLEPIAVLEGDVDYRELIGRDEVRIPDDAVGLPDSRL